MSNYTEAKLREGGARRGCRAAAGTREPPPPFGIGGKGPTHARKPGPRTRLHGPERRYGRLLRGGTANSQINGDASRSNKPGPGEGNVRQAAPRRQRGAGHAAPTPGSSGQAPRQLLAVNEKRWERAARPDREPRVKEKTSGASARRLARDAPVRARENRRARCRDRGKGAGAGPRGEPRAPAGSITGQVEPGSPAA